jgi:hypothetical protein
VDERERQKLRELVGHYDEIAAEAENIRRRLSWAGSLAPSRDHLRGDTFPAGQRNPDRDTPGDDATG